MPDQKEQLKKISPIEFHFVAEKQQFVFQFLESKQNEYDQQEVISWLTPTLMESLEEKIEQSTVKRLAEDSYYFLYDKRLWAQYLIAQMKTVSSPKLKKRLYHWQHPNFFFGEIIDVQEKYVILQHAWTKEKVYVLDFSANEEHIGQDVVLLLIKGIEEDIYYSLSLALVLNKSNNALFDFWKIAFDTSDEQQYGQFFTNQIALCWQLLSDLSSETRTLSEDAKQLLLMLDASLVQLDQKSDPLFLFFHQYLKTKTLPKAEKKLSIIAGVLHFGMKFKFIPRIIGVRELAQLCDISTTTLYNYSRKMERYYRTEFKEWHLLEGEKILYFAGTDATVKDREEWAFQKLCEERHVTDELGKKRIRHQIGMQPFVPKRAHDLAQHFAFEAYQQTYEKDRIEFADAAYRYNPICLDALLLLSDYNREFMTEALQLVKKETDVTMINRVYFKQAAFAFDARKMEEAFGALVHVTRWTGDEPYLRLAVLLAMNETFAVKKYLESLPDNAITRWFQWAIDESDENYHRAMMSNIFVDKYIAQQVEPLSYPRHCFYTEGCPVQGKYIYLLLYPVLKNKFHIADSL